MGHSRGHTNTPHDRTPLPAAVVRSGNRRLCCRLNTVNGKLHRKHRNRPCVHRIFPKGLLRGETILFRGNGGFGVPEAAHQGGLFSFLVNARSENFVTIDVYFEDEPAAIRGQVAHMGRGAADCGEYRKPVFST